MAEAPHRELTDPENDLVLGTLSHQTWIGLAVEEINADFYRLGNPRNYFRDVGKIRPQAQVGEKVDVGERLIHIARLSSASLNGEGRKDLTAAIVGSPQQSSSLSIPILNAQGVQAPAAKEEKKGWGRS